MPTIFAEILAVILIFFDEGACRVVHSEVSYSETSKKHDGSHGIINRKGLKSAGKVVVAIGGC